MGQTVSCPSCHVSGLDIHEYDSMMVLRSDLALFTLRCPACGTKVSSLHVIPPDLRDAVDFAAIEVGAGMGRS